MIGSQTKPQLRNEDWLRDQYLGRGKSVNQIASELSASNSTVQTALERFNIPRRNQKEASALRKDRGVLAKYWRHMNKRQEAALVELTQGFVDDGRDWDWRFDPETWRVYVRSGTEHATIHRSGTIDFRTVSDEKPI